MSGPITLLTGLPHAPLARKLLGSLQASPGSHEIWALAASGDVEAVEALGAAREGAVRVVEGEPWRIDLGLAGAELVELAERLVDVHHVPTTPARGAARDLAAPRHPAEAARELLELSDASPALDRVVFWSTAWVSGRREGRVLESELGGPAGFHGEEERGLHDAEAVLRRALDTHRITILRPGVMVGDARTGELDVDDGAYLLFRLLLQAPRELRLPLPGRGEAPLHFVPIDWVVAAGRALAADPAAVGGTYHLVDANAPSARRAYELIADAAGRPPPRGFVPASLAKALGRLPGIERVGRPARLLFEQLGTHVVFDDRSARALLEPRGLTCPAFASYVDAIVRFVRENEVARATG